MEEVMNVDEKDDQEEYQKKPIDVEKLKGSVATAKKWQGCKTAEQPRGVRRNEGDEIGMFMNDDAPRRPSSGSFKCRVDKRVYRSLRPKRRARLTPQPNVAHLTALH
ncbi:hypothetical protein MHYP_G00239080 [Metynnis hypsauchen]